MYNTTFKLLLRNSISLVNTFLLLIFLVLVNMEVKVYAWFLKNYDPNDAQFHAHHD